jgi:hypothetical protein
MTPAPVSVSEVDEQTIDDADVAGLDKARAMSHTFQTCSPIVCMGWTKTPCAA